MTAIKLPPLPKFDEWAYPSRDLPDMELVGYTAEAMTAYAEAAVLAERESRKAVRTCTCHPDDNPPKPCEKKFAYSECAAAIRNKE